MGKRQSHNTPGVKTRSQIKKQLKNQCHYTLGVETRPQIKKQRNDTRSLSLKTKPQVKKNIEINIMSRIPQSAVTPEDWEKSFYCKVDSIPPPSSVLDILNQQCPFDYGKLIKDTHQLVYIPANVNDQPLSLELLDHLLYFYIDPDKKHAADWQVDYCCPSDHEVLYTGSILDMGGLGNESCWLLVYIGGDRGVYPPSKNKAWHEQKTMFEELNKTAGGHYILPTLGVMYVATLMRYIKTGQKSFETIESSFYKKAIYGLLFNENGYPCDYCGIGNFNFDGIYTVEYEDVSELLDGMDTEDIDIGLSFVRKLVTTQVIPKEEKVVKIMEDKKAIRVPH